MDERASRRDLPSVDEALQSVLSSALCRGVSPGLIAERARRLIDDWRADIERGALSAADLGERKLSLAAAVARRVEEVLSPSLFRVINATGVVVHTNLGRAPWPRRALERAMEVAAGYSNLEYDLEPGERGEREAHVRSAQALFGAEAALVVNNNAAAVLLVLNSLAQGKETVVSRGELVEIGGSFRIPDVLERSGSDLREVGATNRTRLADYQAAIGPRTALLLKVHPSNYRILGFTEEVPLAALVELGHAHGLAVIEDLGSGGAVDLSPAGLHDETTVTRSIAAGADLVTFSGDKLLGGPQAGIIVGKAALVQACKKNPLYRALRPDKVTLAALEELLCIYRGGDPWTEVPVLRALAMPYAVLETRAKRLTERLTALGYEAAVTAGKATVGGGASPLSEIPSPQVAVRSKQITAHALAARLRRGQPPVVARIEDGRLLVDLRAVAEDEEAPLASAFAAAVRS